MKAFCSQNFSDPRDINPSLFEILNLSIFNPRVQVFFYFVIFIRSIRDIYLRDIPEIFRFPGFFAG